VSTFASVLYPVPRRFIGIAKEAVAGAVVAPTYTFPMVTFKPVDKITYLKDSGWRNSMADFYTTTQGAKISELSMGGPMFADGIGYMLADILGDYYQSVNGTSTTATTLSAPYTAGATTLSVTSAANLSTGATFAVGTLSTTGEEVRTVATLSGTTVTPNAPLYQNHASGQPVTPYSSVVTYVHNFALLNNGAGMGGFLNAQPPTYTITDAATPVATTGARNYAYTCLSELSLQGSANELVMWEAKATALASGTAASTPVNTLTTVAPEAAWRSTVTIGGTQEYNGMEWKLAIHRKVEPKFTDSGQQDPFAIGRGVLGAVVSFQFDPAVDETEFLLFQNNTQPTLSIVAGNGLAGSSFSSVAITAQVAVFDTGEIVDSRELFGYDLSATLLANSTNVGPSGAVGPCVITLTNAIPNY
jgi:hypothetical protein